MWSKLQCKVDLPFLSGVLKGWNRGSWLGRSLLNEEGTAQKALMQVEIISFLNRMMHPWHRGYQHLSKKLWLHSFYIKTVLSYQLLVHYMWHYLVKKMGGTSCPQPRSVRGSSVLWGETLSCIQGAPGVAGRQSECTPPCRKIASPSSSPRWLQSPELWWTFAVTIDHCCRGYCWWSSPPHCDPEPGQGNCRAPWFSEGETWPNLHTWPSQRRDKELFSYFIN